MGSQWHFRWKGEEKGPVSFQDLAQLLRGGGLSADDFVRRVRSKEWVRARDVIGLLRLAGMESAEEGAEAESAPSIRPAAPVPIQPAVTSTQTGTKPKRFKRIGWPGILIGSIVAVAVLLVGATIWRHYAHPRFPRRPDVASAKRQDLRERVLAAAAAARSTSSSVPGLKSAVPQLVPGLEAMSPTGSFSLTDDLCTIAFAAPGPSTKSSDLWTAKRDSVSSPFAPAALITSCNTSRFESKPSLSPDGLDILFMRAENGSHWFLAKRSSPSLDFDKPEPWLPPGLSKIAGEITFTRFLDAQRVLMSVKSADTKPPFSFYLVERQDMKHDFGAPQEIVLDGCGAWACVRPNCLLAYFGTAEGLFIQGRDSLSERFCPGQCILEPDVCGPVQGAIWVAPGDDVAFYCSPGPGKEAKEKARICMIRF